MRLAVLAIALFVTAIAAGGFPAPALARTMTRASLRASANTARVYIKLTLTGRLTTKAGRSLSKRLIRLETRPATGGAWSLVSAKTTDSKGRAGWGVQPMEDQLYRVRYPGSSQYRATVSSYRKIIGHHYGLRFADEFTGSAVATSVWTTQARWGDTSMGLIDRTWAGALSVTRGSLIITATHPTPTVDSEYPYLSGVISSHGPGQYNFKYGYIETRTMIPRGQGLWPAVWMLGVETSATSEIDIMEARGQLPNTNLMSLHFHGDQVGKSYVGDDLTKSFHTFGVDWSPDHVIWYRDGVERFRVTDKSEVSHDTMYLIANLQLGNGVWATPPNASTPFPAKFYIDYIRVYQHN
ncbi:MAG: glycoside hydrolase family 16 protein [Coriobacteriia bacterium]|nr:glycoside hydrolase family 16 protein [Coriobacteriia bacterium]